MRHPRVVFAARWLIGGVAFVLALVATCAGVMRGWSIHLQAVVKRRAEAAEVLDRPPYPYEVCEFSLDDVSGAEAMRQRPTDYQKIASKHADEVRSLDLLLHPGQAINGISIAWPPSFSDDYYRDPAEWRRRLLSRRDWHDRLAEKYRQAALRPWQSVPPDPPKPE
jgi:hypothetical protein